MQIAQERHADWIALGHNLGFAPAVNRGIQETDADWIAILNNDVTLAPDWLEQLLKGSQAKACATVGFLTGKILSTADPTIVDATFDELARSGCAWRCGSGKADAPVWNEGRSIRIAPMTAALFRIGPLR